MGKVLVVEFQDNEVGMPQCTASWTSASLSKTGRKSKCKKVWQNKKGYVENKIVSKTSFTQMTGFMETEERVA